MSVLIDRSGHRAVLSQRNAGERGEEAACLGAARRVAVDPAVALLEGDRRAEGEGVIGAEEVPEESAEDVEALGVDRSGELRFPFDVDRARGAGADRRGDPRGEAVGEGAGADDGQSVHLTDFTAGRRDAQTAVGDHASEVASGEIGAALRVAHRGLDVIPLDRRLRFFRGEERRLARDVREPSEAGGQAIVPSRDPRPVFGEGGDGARVEGGERLFLRDPREDARVVLDRLRGALESRLEVGEDLEEL